MYVIHNAFLQPNASRFVLTTAMVALLPPAFNFGGGGKNFQKKIIGRTSRNMRPRISVFQYVRWSPIRQDRDNTGIRKCRK